MLSFTKSIKVDVMPNDRKKSLLDTNDYRAYVSGNASYGRLLDSALDFNTMNMMYKYNVWVRSCVDKIVKRAVAVRPIVKSILRKPTDKPSGLQQKRVDDIEELLAVPNDNQQSLQSILTSMFTDLLIWDAGALELSKGKRTKDLVALYPVSGDSIRKNVDQRGRYKSSADAYWQVDSSGGIVQHFAVDEIIYSMQYPRPARVYGLSPLETLRQTVTAELYAADFNLERFSNDATPRFAILFDNLGAGQGGAALQRFREWWEKELRGQPHKPIMVGSEHGQVRFEKVGMSNEDMQFQEYSRWLLTKIMAIYHMQAFVLGVLDVNQGRLNSGFQEEQFKKDALAPLLYSFSSSFNTLAVWSKSNMGYNDVYLDWEGMDRIDRKLEAEIHEIYLRHGVYTINMVLEQLGIDPVPWGDKPYMLSQMVPVGEQQQLSQQAAAGKKVPADPNAQAKQLVQKLLMSEGYERYYKSFSLDNWLSLGIHGGGIVPTGLERVEPSEIKSAIAKLAKAANKKSKPLIVK